MQRAVEAIAAEQFADAERCVSELFTEIRQDDDPAAVGGYVFGAALARRLSPRVEQEANLYLSQFEIPQIRLFNLLADEVPQVGLTTVIANRYIASALPQGPHATIIDIGIGTGRQMTSLLELLHEESQVPDCITLIGIEPSGSSLECAEQNVQSTARKLGANVEFHGFQSSVERLDRRDWSRLLERCPSPPVVNGSFAFHHIDDMVGCDARNDVLLRLRSLQPVAIVLAEPDVHHIEPDFVRRFENCWNHFDTTFRVIDELPIAKQQDKDALKVSFFGREIADILGNPEGQRSERHESTASWLRRLHETGFATCLDVELPESGPVIGVTGRNGYATLDYGDDPLVAVLAARPNGGAFDVEGALARAPRG